jgi:ribosomal protein S27E
MTHLDGNAVAGRLREIFTAEMTTVQRRCQSCGHDNAIGAHRVYESAGIVVRCPHCDDVAATLIDRAGGHVIVLRGVWQIAP